MPKSDRDEEAGLVNLRCKKSNANAPQFLIRVSSVFNPGLNMPIPARNRAPRVDARFSRYARENPTHLPARSIGFTRFWPKNPHGIISAKKGVETG